MRLWCKSWTRVWHCEPWTKRIVNWCPFITILTVSASVQTESLDDKALLQATTVVLNSCRISWAAVRSERVTVNQTLWTIYRPTLSAWNIELVKLQSTVKKTMPSRHSSHHRVRWRLSDGSVTWGVLWMGGPHRLPGPRPSLPSNSQRCSGSRPSPGPHRWAGCRPRSSSSLTAWARRCCLRWGCWRRWISPSGSRWRSWGRSDSGGPTPPSSKRRWRA